MYGEHESWSKTSAVVMSHAHSFFSSVSLCKRFETTYMWYFGLMRVLFRFVAKSAGDQAIY